jgi:protein subunit release factor B
MRYLFGEFMAFFAVSEEKNRWLQQQMNELDIREQDIEEKFIRSAGKGGQNVNKTSSCVYLRHKPTGIEVKCMKDRSQSINRFLARRELVERIKKMRGLLTTEDLVRKRIRRRKVKQKQRRQQKSANI